MFFLSCSNTFNQLQSSSESDDKNIIFEIPDAMIAGDFSNSTNVQTRVYLLPRAFTSKCISFAKSYNNFYPVNLQDRHYSF